MATSIVRLRGPDTKRRRSTAFAKSRFDLGLGLPTLPWSCLQLSQLLPSFVWSLVQGVLFFLNRVSLSPCRSPSLSLRLVYLVRKVSFVSARLCLLHKISSFCNPDPHANPKPTHPNAHGLHSRLCPTTSRSILPSVRNLWSMSSATRGSMHASFGASRGRPGTA